MKMNASKKRSLVLCAALFLVGAGIGWAETAPRPMAAPNETADVETAILRQDYAEAEKLAKAFLAKKPKKAVSHQAQYYLGLSQLEQGRYDEAADSFQKINKSAVDSSLREKACLGLFDSYYLKEDYDEAHRIIEQLLKQDPPPQGASLIYLKLARVNLKLARWGEAHDYLKKITASFPNSLEVPLAKQLLEEKQYFAVQVGSFRDRTLAEQLVGELKQKQEYAYIVEAGDQQDRKFYRVRVGQLALLKEAKKLESRLSQAGYPTKIYP